MNIVKNYTLSIFNNTVIPFIIEVDTTKTGRGSASDQFQFTDAEGDYGVVAKQNGVVIETFNNLSDEETITLPSSGIYVLEVTPKATNGFNRIAFNAGGDKDKMLDIKQWGDVVWSSFERAFWGCSNMLVTATDRPNLSSVTSMSFMFRDATSVNPDVSLWDVSNVTEMFLLFFGATSANPDVSNWNVSNVTDMESMFAITSSANPDVSNWDVSNVTNMRYMFYFATSANPDISNWNVSSVTDMYAMFYFASSANPNVSNWDVSSVTNMAYMFQGANLSEENLTACYENWSQLSLQQNVDVDFGDTQYFESGQAGRDILINTYNWTITDGGVKIPFIMEVDTTRSGVSNSEQFEFTGAEGDYDVIAKQNDTVVASFDNLSGEETITLPSSGVYDLEVIPKVVNGFNRIAFNSGGDKVKITDIKQWGDVVWSSFERAFWGCRNMLVTATDVPDLSSVTSMFSMFEDATVANPNTRDWNVSNVTDMQSMFYQVTSANPDVSNWDVSNVTDMYFIFFGASSANPDVSNWDVSNVTNMAYMFRDASSANPDVSLWDVSNVTDMSDMFYGASSANPDVSLWDVSNVTNMSSVFSNATSANPDVSNWNVGSVTDMDRMFSSTTVANPDVSNWNVSSVTDMSFMFRKASSANPDVSNWDVSNVTDMAYMFELSNLSVENLTIIYENWSQLSLQNNVQFGAGTIKYNTSGQAGRYILINTYNWNITDGGQI